MNITCEIDLDIIPFDILQVQQIVKTSRISFHHLTFTQ